MRYGLAATAFCLAAVLAHPAARAGDGEEKDHRAGDPNTMTFTWEAEVRLAETGVATIDATINAWLEKHVSEAVREASVNVSADPGIYRHGRWGIWGEGEVQEAVPGAVSVVYTLSEYPLGAAHPMNTVVTFNYALPDGTPLAFADLFDRPEEARTIIAREAPDIILSALRRDCPELFTGDEPMGMSAFFTDGFAPTPENYAAVSIVPNALVVHFQEYQILPYAFGRPEAVIPLELLRTAGPKKAIWENGAEG